MAIAIRACAGPDELAAARDLFREYAQGLGVDLAFQGFEAELAALPGKYAAPDGEILLAWEAGQAVGCVALRPLPSPGECEMKRLYVRGAARGQALGRRLAEAIIGTAQMRGYMMMRLDTLAQMDRAPKLYAALGFVPTAPYYDNPLPGTRYMALDLGGLGAPQAV